MSIEYHYEPMINMLILPNVAPSCQMRGIEKSQALLFSAPHQVTFLFSICRGG